MGLLWPHLCCISLRKEKHCHYLLRVPCLIFLHYPVPILQYITYSLVDHLSLSLKGKLARTWILVGPSCFPQRMESPNIFLMKNEQMGKNKQKFTKTGGLLLKRDTLKTEGFRKLESEMAVLLNWYKACISNSLLHYDPMTCQRNRKLYPLCPVSIKNNF